MMTGTGPVTESAYNAKAEEAYAAAAARVLPVGVHMDPPHSSNPDVSPPLYPGLPPLPIGVQDDSYSETPPPPYKA